MSSRQTLEQTWRSRGWTVAGVDEVGRGCLAGPVYAAAVILDYDQLEELSPQAKSRIRDSKTLSIRQRERALEDIGHIAIDKGIGHASVSEIDTLGIVEATWLAMRRALKVLTTEFSLIAVDGPKTIPKVGDRQEAIVDGDKLCKCIAAASIVAKVARDAYMQKQGDLFPQYGFSTNVGYGTKKHLDALRQEGTCAIHRQSFAPVKSAANRARSVHEG